MNPSLNIAPRGMLSQRSSQGSSFSLPYAQPYFRDEDTFEPFPRMDDSPRLLEDETIVPFEVLPSFRPEFREAPSPTFRKPFPAKRKLSLQRKASVKKKKSLRRKASLPRKLKKKTSLQRKTSVKRKRSLQRKASITNAQATQQFEIRKTVRTRRRSFSEESQELPMMKK